MNGGKLDTVKKQAWLGVFPEFVPAEVPGNALDHRRFKAGRDNLELAATARAVLEVSNIPNSLRRAIVYRMLQLLTLQPATQAIGHK